MKSLFCYSLLFLSLLSCKTAPDAIPEMDVYVIAYGNVRLSNTSTACLAENFDVDWGDGVKEHTTSNAPSHLYHVKGTYTVTLTVYNIDNKPFKVSQKVTITSL